MVCKTKPSETETLTCKTCTSEWHVTCLSSPPESVLNTLQWECPDCSGNNDSMNPAQTNTTSNDLIASIRAIEADSTLTEQEKAKKRQQLMSNGGKESEADDDEKKKSEGNDVMDILDGSFSCSFCMQLPERPVTVMFSPIPFT